MPNNLPLLLTKMEHDFEVFSLELNRANEAIAKLDKWDKYHAICSSYAEYIHQLLVKATCASSLSIINSYYHELTGNYLSYDPKRRTVVITVGVRR